MWGKWVLDRGADLAESQPEWVMTRRTQAASSRRLCYTASRVCLLCVFVWLVVRHSHPCYIRLYIWKDKWKKYGRWIEATLQWILRQQHNNTIGRDAVWVLFWESLSRKLSIKNWIWYADLDRQWKSEKDKKRLKMQFIFASPLFSFFTFSLFHFYSFYDNKQPACEMCLSVTHSGYEMWNMKYKIWNVKQYRAIESIKSGR